MAAFACSVADGGGFLTFVRYDDVPGFKNYTCWHDMACEQWQRA